MVVTVSLVSALGPVDLNSDGMDVCRQPKADKEATQLQVPLPHLPYSSKWVRVRPPYGRVLFSSFFSSLLPLSLKSESFEVESES